jgi:hypothetical protein
MADLFDEPAPNSPEDLGGLQTPAKRAPKPWHTDHPDHPANRPHNRLEPGEAAPTSWNVAHVEMGIEQMRTFLTWCTDHDIDTDGHTVGGLYVGLNAHSKLSFRWLCQVLVQDRHATLPDVGLLDRAIKKRGRRLLYPQTEPERRA